MTRDLSRLLNPKTVAVIGGGAWCHSVVAQLQKIGYCGDLHAVHPRVPDVGGIPAVRSVHDLPRAPDAAFLGINRDATVTALAELAAIGAGGAVCFASGFLEAEAEDRSAPDRQRALIAAAGDMPVLGPNCYGYVNALDRAALWPDQHGLVPVDSGVAIITQSSNMAINLSMHRSGLPVSHLVTAGNQAQTGMAAIGRHLLQDPRVTALGLHIEGIGDIRAFETLVRSTEKPIVALKVGRSHHAQLAAVSHTASLAGRAEASSAFLRRCGVGETATLSEFLAALLILHNGGPLPNARIGSMSCSGGEASLMADAGLRSAVTFPPLTRSQKARLGAILGPRVALANPLDYHTYIWGDADRMGQVFSAMATLENAITLLVLDLPRADRCDPAAWNCAIDAVTQAASITGHRFGVVSSLPENMPEAVAHRFLSAGIIPFGGIDTALGAIAAVSRCRPGPCAAPVLLGARAKSAERMNEHEAKTRLAAFGLAIPAGHLIEDTEGLDRAARLSEPLVLKSLAHAHRSEHGHVKTNLGHHQLASAATAMPPPWRVEEMVEQGIVELLVAVTRDTAHGFMLTLGAGGTLTELTRDTTTLLVPASRAEVEAALRSLRIAPLFDGYLGGPAVDLAAILDAVDAVQRFACAHADGLEEIEINPLIATKEAAIAADALIRMEQP